MRLRRVPCGCCPDARGVDLDHQSTISEDLIKERGQIHLATTTFHSRFDIDRVLS